MIKPKEVKAYKDSEGNIFEKQHDWLLSEGAIMEKKLQEEIDIVAKMTPKQLMGWKVKIVKAMSGNSPSHVEDFRTRVYDQYDFLMELERIRKWKKDLEEASLKKKE